MNDNEVEHINDERRPNSIKLEVLDHYPDDKPFSAHTYVQGIEKVGVPETKLFVIELKGHHIQPKADPKYTNDITPDYPPTIHNNKTLSILDPLLRKEVKGKGIHKKCKDYSAQVSILNGYEIYHFTLTEGTGQRRYLTSLIVFELCLDIKQKRAYLVPMVYSLVSCYPVFNFQKQCLTTIFND